MFNPAFRLLSIATTLARYRLDELLELLPGLRFVRRLRLLLPRPRGDIAQLARGVRLRLALQELGPLFVKFGQILSTRRDLIPADIADELTLLQDRVQAFPGELAEREIERVLGAPIGKLFRSFERLPLASASIAQVHAALLPDGSEVVVKVLRPNVEARIAADLGLLRLLAGIAERHLPNADKIQPREIVAEIERTLNNELDLQREGANASQLRRNFEHSPDLLIPKVYWDWSGPRVLTLERVRGIPSDDLAALDAAGIDRVALAEKGVRLFYQQVFRDNFFHADAHPGNIWVDAARTENPRFIALDFGIMGTLPEADQYYLAENFRAMFSNNYRRIAELHIEAGWMPAHIRVDELEAAVRSVCEPYFSKPIAEVSLGEVLARIFKLVQRYELTVQPQLLLLQKTLLNIEGVGRLLHPKLDLIAVARPVLEAIIQQRYSLAALRDRFAEKLPELARHAPELPHLFHAWLQKAANGTQSLEIRSREMQALVDESREGQRRTVFAVLGAGLLVAAALLYGLNAEGPRWLGFQLPLLVAIAGSIAAFLAALHRRG
ncbi:MAG: ubiquinone biosynthesis regulatory protein kinase UbiB [Lysobacterales bacterium CG02_land_8_20_14_3_00_62_12]|nr:MAG: ubiquinone biosynthesis regulatory protein kinase UbiB [Xanthomonadales bacterium CG02_land_8_20_14_3_00_62_12]